MDSNAIPVALVTGGSTSLGFVIARTLITGYRVMMLWDGDRLNQAMLRLDLKNCVIRMVVANV